jgi:hypothetical protein
MKVAIIDLLVDIPPSSALGRVYGLYFRKQFMSIAPQAVAVWCRQLGHETHYATYYGQTDPLRLIPPDVEVLFVSSYTQASALAYALATEFRRRATRTVIGGPHARAFPTDCLRFFDIVVRDCDKQLVDDILRGRFDRPALATSGRQLTEFPTVAERAPEIETASLHGGRRLLTSLVPMLSSVGCPYSCDFCVDWNSRYVALPPEQFAADLDCISRRWPGMLVGYHDPNFAVRFDQTMDVIEALPPARRNPYIMESSLSILRGPRLERLRRTNCVYAAPGIESWVDYGNKTGAPARQGRLKLGRVVAQMEALGEHVPGLQANFLFGGDDDSGAEPAALTIEFIRRLPKVWPTINIPSPFGGTPLYDAWHREGRILEAMPFAFYYNPYLAIVPRHYDPVDYYDHLIRMHEAVASPRMLLRRLSTRAPAGVRFVHALRTVAARHELRAFRHIRAKLVRDARFQAFHQGRRADLPEFYHALLDRRLGRYAELFPRHVRRPALEPPSPPTGSHQAA